MDCTVRLSRDGTVTLPLLGIVRLAGQTANEAGATLRDLLGRDYIRNPQVTVTVLEFTRQTFTILGQVLKPGVVQDSQPGRFYPAPGHRPGRRLHPHRECLECHHQAADRRTRDAAQSECQSHGEGEQRRAVPHPARRHDHHRRKLLLVPIIP